MAVTRALGIEHRMRVVGGIDPTGNVIALGINSATGGLLVALSAPTINNIVPFAGATTDVSVLTPLIALRQPGQAYRTLLFAVDASECTQAITVFVDCSSDGIHAESGNQQSFTVPAGQALSLEIGPFPSRPYWALAAQSANASVQAIKFAWIGAGG